jgi:hypothetical protein
MNQGNLITAAYLFLLTIGLITFLAGMVTYFAKF